MALRNPYWFCVRLLILALVAAAALFARRAWGGEPPVVPVVHVLATDPCGAELGSETATFTVYRDGPTNAPLTIRYWVTGSASNGVDYALLTGEVTIPASASSAPITVRPVDDALVEGGETVAVFLSQPIVWPPPYIVCWPSFAVGHIEDDDLAPTNRPPLVRITNPPDGAVFLGEVDLRLAAGASDLDGRVRSVEFFNGTNSLGVVYHRPILIEPVPILGDALLELADEREPNLFPDLVADPVLDPGVVPTPIPIPLDSFVLVWSNVPPGNHVLTALATDNLGATTRSEPVRIQVVEVPPQPVVSIKAIDPVATEPDDTATRLDTATFLVHRTGNTDFPLTVYYRIGGTAQNGVDYRELTRSVTIPRGARGAGIVVAPLPDALVEGPESVALTLVAPACIEIYPPPPECYLVGRDDTARAVINDNDPANHPPLVELVRPLDGTVFLAPADIEIAASARDYDGRVVTVEFFEGTNSLGRVTNNWTILTTNRPVFAVKWPNVGPGHYLLTAVATDNAGAQGRSKPVEIKVVERTARPVVTIASVDSDAAEVLLGGTPNPAVFAVKRSGPVDRELLVRYSVGGSAVNGLDYRTLSGEVKIPAGAPAARIIVEPIDDRLVEGTESVGITIEPPICIAIFPPPYDCYLVGAEDTARAAIRDNDLLSTNMPPKVALIRPEPGSVFTSPASIGMVAAAADADGWIRTVEFFEGANRLGVVSNAALVPLDPAGVIGVDPALSQEELFRFVWETAPAGEYTLTARATDNRGASSWSEPVRIRVIDENRLPVVSIEATDPRGSESAWWIQPLEPAASPDGIIIIDPPVLLPDIAVFTVKRDRGTNFPLTVYYQIGGTASNGVDYGLLRGQVTIPAGQYSAPITIAPIDDSLVEGTETVIIGLLPSPCPVLLSPLPACYQIGDPGRAVAFIGDNDFANELPKVEIVRPGNDQVFRAGTDIEIAAVTRDPDGYVNEVSFFANDRFIGRDRQVFLVAPPPGQEQRFSIVWSNVPPGQYLLTAKAADSGGGVGGSDPISIKVVEVCSETVVNIEAYDPVATEQSPLIMAAIPPDQGRFRVTRSCNIERALTVYYEVGGTADNGVDYRRLGGEIVIPAGARSADIVVDPIDDELFEGPETVIVKLSPVVCTAVDPIAPGCYVIGPAARDSVTLRDNDSARPRVAIVRPETGEQFRAGADVPIVAQALDPDGWVSLVEFFANDRKIGEDAIVFIQAPPPGELQRFSMVWSNAPVGRFMLTARATDNHGQTSVSGPVVIEVRETPAPPLVTVFAIDPIAREGLPLNPAMFRIRRSGPTNEALTVHFSVRGTASNGVDYARLPSSVTIPAGRRGVRLPITPIDDRLNERFETVIVRLLDTALYNVGRPGAAGALILDNDCPRPDSCALPEGDFHLRRGPDGLRCYRVEASADLTKWELVGSNVLDDDSVHFVDPDAGGVPHRFYRIVPCLDVEVDMLGDD